MSAHIGQMPLGYWLRRRGDKFKAGIDPMEMVEAAGEEAVVKYIETLVADSRNFMERHWYEIWKRNIFFVYGAQHIEQDAEGSWHPRDITEDMRRVVNFILQLVLRAVSDKVGAKPTWGVVPYASAPEENMRARTSERMLKSTWNGEDLLPLRLLSAMTEEIFGSALVKVQHNEKGGPVEQIQIPIMTPDGPLMGDDGEPVTAPGPFKAQGIVEHSEVSPFYFHVPSGRRTPIVDKLPWVIEDPPMDLHEIWQRYGFDAKHDTEGKDPIYTIATDFARLMEAPDMGFQDSRPRDQATHLQYHEEASIIPGLEKGIRITIINSRIVDARKAQQPNSFPYVHFCTTTRDGTFWGHSKVNEMIDPQRYINEDAQLLAQARDLGASPFLWDQSGSGISEASFVGGPRVLTSPVPPQWLDTPQLSQALIEDARENKANLDRVASQHGPSRGELPGKSPHSAQSLEFMEQAEKSSSQPQLLWSGWALASWGQKTLQIIKDFSTNEQVYVLAGKSSDPESFMAGPQNIPQRFVVQVQQDSALQELKEPLRQRVLAGLQGGMYGQQIMQDEMRLQKLRDHVDFPTPSELIPPEEWDRRNAIAEAAALIEQGENPMAEPLENHQVHFAEHVLRMKHPDWKRWSDEQKKVWMAHIQHHQKLLEAEQASQQTEQFTQLMTQAAVEASGRGKFRDSEALLLVIRGILEQLNQKEQEALTQAEQIQEATLQTQGGG